MKAETQPENQNRAFDFARIFGVSSTNTTGGSLTTLKGVSDADLETIENPASGLVDPPNVVGIFFDIDDWDHTIPHGLIENTKHPAQHVERVEDGKSLKFTSEVYSTVYLTTEYIEQIGELIGKDIEKHPSLILMNRVDEFPVLVRDTQSEGTIILAPRLPPEEQA